MVGGFLAICVVLVLALFLTRKGSKEPQPTPPPTTPIESVLPPPNVRPSADAETRSTVGRIAAILEAINQYSKARKSFPSL
jgi:hypothetical protein